MSAGNPQPGWLDLFHLALAEWRSNPRSRDAARAMARWVGMVLFLEQALGLLMSSLDVGVIHLRLFEGRGLYVFFAATWTALDLGLLALFAMMPLVAARRSWNTDGARDGEKAMGVYSASVGAGLVLAAGMFLLSLLSFLNFRILYALHREPGGEAFATGLVRTLAFSVPNVLLVAVGYSLYCGAVGLRTTLEGGPGGRSHSRTPLLLIFLVLGLGLWCCQGPGGLLVRELPELFHLPGTTASGVPGQVVLLLWSLVWRGVSTFLLVVLMRKALVQDFLVVRERLFAAGP